MTENRHTLPKQSVQQMEMKNMKLFTLLVLAVVVSGCSVVGPGERGVRISLGKASDDVKEPGAYFWLPGLLGMARVTVQVQKSEIESSAASKDMQEIAAHVAVNWSLSPDQVVKTYKAIGDEDDVLERILKPAVNEVMKSAVSKRTAEEALTKRMELKQDIDEALKARLSHYGITVSDISIVNFTFSKEFTNAIEAKQIAEQQAKQAEYVAQKAIQQAKAEVNAAKGQAEAQRLVRETLTPLILQQRAIEKWNGQFPQVMGSGSLPFLNLKLAERQ